MRATPARNKPIGRPRELALTAHFKRRWAERVEGSPPSPERIGEMVRQSIRVQPQRELWRLDAWGNACPVQVNGIYWHPGAGVVMVIDEEKRNAVTVFGFRDWEWGGE